MELSYFVIITVAFFLLQINGDDSDVLVENKEEQCIHPLDIAFVVDASGSISAKNYQLQKDFIKNVMEINYLSRDGAHAGVVLFSQTSSTAIKLNEYYKIDEFKEGVQSLRHEFSITRIDRGLKTAYDQLFTKGYGSRYNVPRILFLLTDGKQTRSGDFIEPTIAVLPLREIGIKIIAIGIGAGVDKSELEQITGDTNAVFTIRNFKQLLDVNFLEKFDYACHPGKLKKFAPSLPANVTAPVIQTTPATNAQLVDYFVALDITNNDDRNVTFKYKQDRVEKEFTVMSKSKHITEIKIQSATYPLPINFKAYDSNTGNLIQLRDRDQLLVIPRTTKIFESIVIEPEVAEAFINFNIENKLNEGITLIWQQNGERKFYKLEKNAKAYKEIVFDRSKGISPIDFTGFTNAKKLPVKLNGNLEAQFTPIISKKNYSLIMRKAVKDFYILMDLINEATGAVVVAWKQGNADVNAEVDIKGTESREIVFKDLLKAPSIEFRGYLKESREPVTLNGRRNVGLRAGQSKGKRRIFIRKNYYIDLNLDNQAAEEVIISWIEKGIKKTLEVQSGAKRSEARVFSGPTANEPLIFYAVTKNTNSPVKLNGKDSIQITPTSTRKEANVIATIEYFLDVDIVNNADDDIIVNWNSKEGKKSVDIKQGSTKRVEIVEIGPHANNPIKFNALIKDQNAPVQLNGKESVLFTPAPVKKTKEAVATRKYFLGLRVENKAADDVVVLWKDNGKAKSLEIPKQSMSKKEIALEGPNAKEPVQFSAVLKGTNEPVQLNGQESLILVPSSIKTVQNVVASKNYFLDVEFKNEAADDVVVTWKENVQGKSVEIKKETTGKHEIILDGPDAKEPVQFTSVIKGTNEPVQLNGKESVTLVPLSSKKKHQLVATKKYFLDVEFRNEAVGDIVVNWNENGKEKSLEVKKGSTGKQEIILNGPDANRPIQFKSIMKGTNEPVQLNGQESVTLAPSASKTVQNVVASTNYFLDVEFKNEAADDIVVTWQENGQGKSLEVRKGSTGKQEIILVGLDANEPVQFNAVLIGANVPVQLNGKGSVTLVPLSSKKVHQLIATKKYFLDVEFRNEAAGDIVVNWNENGKEKSLEIKKESTGKQEIILGGPDANRPIQFKSVMKGTNEPVQLNGKDSVTLAPSASKTVQNVVASKNYFLDVEFKNEAADEVVVNWNENGQGKSLEIKKGSTSKQEISLVGPDAKEPVQFSAVLKGTNEPVQLNGQESITLVPFSSKKEHQIVATKKYFMDVEFRNEAADDIVVNWNENGQGKSLEIKKGSTGKQEIILDGPDAKEPVQFSAVLKGTNEPVQLNEKDKVAFSPRPSKDKPFKFVATSPERNYFILLNAVNKRSKGIVVSWEENGVPQKLAVSPNFEAKKEIIVKQGNKDLPIQFVAYTEDGSKPVKLNNSESVQILPTQVKVERTVVASPDTVVLEIINKASADVTVDMRHGDIASKILVPFGGMRKSNVPIYGSNALLLSGVNAKTKHPVQLNGLLNFQVDRDVEKSGTKAIRVVIKDKLCSLKVDIAFVLDASGSILPKQYKLQKQFVAKVAAANKISRDGVHVGVVLFSQTSSVAIKLSDHYNSSDFKSAVDKLKHEYSITRIDKGLKTAYDKLLTKSYGARNGVPKVLFLVTDGKQTRRYNYIEPRIVSMPLKQSGVNLKAIGIGRSADRKELETITGNKDNVYMIKYFNELLKEKFLENFNFNCEETFESPAVFPQPEFAAAPIQFGPTVEYFVALNVENKRKGDVILKWKEAGIPMQRDIAKNSAQRIDIKLKENFYPDPVLFSATDKTTGDKVKLRDRDSLSIIPRKAKTLEKVVLEPDSQFAYLQFDVVNELGEPVIVQWQLNGRPNSETVPAQSTVSKDIKLDRSKPGALSPVIFNARKETSGEPATLNGQNDLEILPTITREKEIIVVKPKRPDSFIDLNVVNQREEDIEVLWKEGDFDKSILVPKLSSRKHLITFPQQQGSKSISFTSHVHGKKETEVVKLNNKEANTFEPTLEIIPHALLANSQPRSLSIDMTNLASGPIVVSWLENGLEKTLDVAKEKNVQKKIVTRGKDASKPISFSAKNKITNAPVKLNGVSKLELKPSLDKKIQPVVALDDPDFKDGFNAGDGSKDEKYIVADFNNLASGPIVVSWLENGLEKTLDVAKEKNVQKTIVTRGKDASKPISFSAKNKITNAPVKLNGASKLELKPLLDKKVQPVVALDDPDFKDGFNAGDGSKDEKYIVADFNNLASGPIVVAWLENGSEKTLDLGKEKNVQKTIITRGKDASKPISFSAKNKITNAPVKLNGVSKLELKPSLDKKVQPVLALDDPDFKDGFNAGDGSKDEKYIAAEFNNLASGPIVVSWLENELEKTLDVAKEKNVQKTIVTRGKDASKPISFSAKNKITNAPVKLNGVSKLELKPTLENKIQPVVALDDPDFKDGFNAGDGSKDEKYIVADFNNLASGPIVVAWLENGSEKTLDLGKEKNVQKTIITRGKDASKPISFSAKNKITNAPVKLNGVSKLELKPSLDKKVQPVVALDDPDFKDGFNAGDGSKDEKYIVADFNNLASGPIVVSWLENGSEKTLDLGKEKNVQKTIITRGKDASKPISFSAKNKITNAPVKLNSASKLELKPSLDKKVQPVVALDDPDFKDGFNAGDGSKDEKYIVADFNNLASGPIVVSWLENGLEKTLDVAKEKNVQKTIVTRGKDASKPISFSAKNKITNAPVKLNGVSKLELKPSLDKKVQPVVALDDPDFKDGFNAGDGSKDEKYIVADFNNLASGPIVVSWLENGLEKTLDVAKEKNVQKAIVTRGKDASKPISFSAKNKITNAPVKLNGVSKLELKPSLDKKVQPVVALDDPDFKDGFNAGDGSKDEKYIVADFNNLASGPIVVSWLENGLEKTLDVAKEKNVQKTIVTRGKDASKPISFSAKNKITNAPVRLNGVSKLELRPSLDKKVQPVVAIDDPDFKDGFNAGDGSKDEKYLVADFNNLASGPIVVSWLENGLKKTLDVAKENNVQKTIVTRGKDASKPISFSAKNKITNAPVKLNGVSKLELKPSLEKKIQPVVALDDPDFKDGFNAGDGSKDEKYIVAEFNNLASGPIVVSWLESGMEKILDVAMGQKVQRKVVIRGKDASKSVTFSAKNQATNAPVMLNGNEKQEYLPSLDLSIKQVIATDQPSYIVANIRNDASEPITVSWMKNGPVNNIDLQPGQTVQETIASQGKDAANPISFTAKGKESNIPIMLNGKEKIELTPSRNKSMKQVIATDQPSYIFANIRNDASEPISLSWMENGAAKNINLQPGQFVQQTIASQGKDAANPISFTAKGKESNIPIMLNGKESIEFTPSRDKSIKQVIATDLSSYIVADFRNDASEPITVSWKKNGAVKNIDLQPGQTVLETIASQGKDAANPISFTAKGMKSNNPIMLNGKERIELTPSRDKSIKQVIATDQTSYIVADFRNDASEPITVSWMENGAAKNIYLQPKQSVQQTIASQGKDAANPISFTAKGKESNIPIMLNGKEKIELTPSNDKSVKQVIATDQPSYIFANIRNDASEPISLSWMENGAAKNINLQPGQFVQQTIASQGKDAANPISFTAKGKESNIPIMLNGKESIEFTPSRDKSIKQVIATDLSSYIVADFRNDASEPITVSWKKNGAVKNIDLQPGQTVLETIASQGKDAANPISFTAKGMKSNNPIMLNGKESIEFTPSSDKSIKQVIATDLPSYIVADFRNDASEPITVSWMENGAAKNIDLQPKQSVQQTIASQGKDAANPISFTAKGKESKIPIMLNGKEKIELTPSNDKSVKQVIATDQTSYIVADFRNDASEPITVSWMENGAAKNIYLQPKQSVQQTIASQGKDAANPISFTAKGKESNIPIMLNGKEKIELTPSNDKSVKQVIATDQPSYIFANIRNDASEPISLSWMENGAAKNINLQPGQFVQQTIASQGKDAANPISFTAKGKESNIPIMLNGKEKIELTPSNDKSVKQVIATDQPSYIFANIRNDASEPITLSWMENGAAKNIDLQPRQSVQQTIASQGKDTSRPISFTAKGKESNNPIMLNGKESIEFTPSRDKSIKQVIATDQTSYIVANIRNDASEPISVSWMKNGAVKNIDLQPGQTVLERIACQGKDASSSISFTAKGKESNIPIMLNGKERIELTPSNDKSIKQVIATDQPSYIVANIRNDASEPITVSWMKDGAVKNIDLQPKQSVQQTIASQGKDTKSPISFTAKGKESNNPIMLNGKEKIELTPSRNKSMKQVIATGLQRAIIANFVNRASQPIVISWIEGEVEKTFDVEENQQVQKTLVFEGKDGSKPISFSAKNKIGNLPVKLNGASNIELTPSSEANVQDIIATNDDLSLEDKTFITAVFKNKAAGPIVISWRENGVERRADLGRQESFKKVFASQGEYSLKPIEFSAKMKDSTALVRLNGEKILKLSPSSKTETVNVIATSRFIDVNFINKASRRATIQWQELGRDKQLQVDDESSKRNLIDFNNAGDVVELSGFYREAGKKIPVTLNRVQRLKLTENEKQQSIDVIIEKRLPKRKPRFLGLDIQNRANEDVILKFEMEGLASDIKIPAKSNRKQLLKTFSDYPVPFKATSEKDGRALFVNKMERLLLTPTETLQRNLVIIEPETQAKPNRYCATISIINKVSEAVVLTWRLGNSMMQLESNANTVSLKRICKPGMNPSSPIKFTTRTKKSRIPLYINGRNSVVVVPNLLSSNIKLYVDRDENRYIDLKAINKLPNDVILEWWYGSGMKKLEVPANKEIGNVISLPYDVKLGVEFRAFKKGTMSQVNVNSRKSIIFNPEQSAKKGIEVIIDSVYFLGYDILNRSPKTALVSINNDGKTKEIIIQPGQREKQMMSVYRNGKRKPITFSARERDSNRALTLNDHKNIQVRPSLTKQYNFMRIDEYRDPSIHYVILDLKNRIREDAIINWNENGINKNKECARSARCTVALKMKTESKEPLPVVFTAKSKQTGARLMINSNASLSVQPMPYRKITGAVIDFQNLGTLICLVISAYASNMNPDPVVIEYKLLGKEQKIQLSGFQKTLREIHLEQLQTQKTVELKAYDQKTRAPLKINGKASFTYAPVKFRSKVFLMVGEPVVNGCKDKKVDTLFIIDSSGTMLYAFEIAKQFITKLTDLYHLSPESTRASVISIAGSTKTFLNIRFSDYYNNTLFKNAVNNLEFKGGKTRIDLALNIASKQAFKPENGGRPGVPKLVFFISDGRQDPKYINGRYVNLFRDSLPLYRIAPNIVSIGVLGKRPVDIGALQLISKNRQNVYNPGNMETIISDIFVRHIFNKYCRI